MSDVAISIFHASDHERNWIKPRIGLKANTNSIHVAIGETVKDGRTFHLDLSAKEVQLMVESLKVLLKDVDKR